MGLELRPIRLTFGLTPIKSPSMPPCFAMSRDAGHVIFIFLLDGGAV